MGKLSLSAVMFVCGACSLFAPLALGATPPGQPATGPGGSDYLHPDEPFLTGQGGVGGWTILEPNPRPTAPAPVVVVIHGNCLLAFLCDAGDVSNLGAYDEISRHLARKGNVVIYPRFQAASNVPSPSQQTQSTLDGIAGAIQQLQTTPGATPLDLNHVGVWGHSRGGWIGANVVALMELQGLPRPDYLFSIAPTNEKGSKIPQENWSTVPSDMLLIVAVGDADTTTGEGTRSYGAGIIFEDSTTVPLATKDYVRVRSDSRGIPALTADHNFVGDSPVDALDWYMVYKLTDALRNCTVLGSDCHYALGDTPEQRHMGVWSDGVPVKELCVTDDPSETWAASCANSLP